MKRAFAEIGFTMLITLLVFGSIKNDTAISIAVIASLIAFAFVMLFKPARRTVSLPVCVMTVFISLCLLFFNNTYKSSLYEEYNGRQVSVLARLEENDYRSRGYKILTLHTLEIDSRKVKTNIRVISSVPIDIEPCDRILLNIKLTDAAEENREYEDYLLTEGIDFSGFVSSAEDYTLIKKCDYSPSQTALLLRKAMSDNIMSVLPDDRGGILCGLLIGDRHNVSGRLTSSFKACGIMHLFAVSGLHLSVWSMLIYRLLKKMRLSEKKASAINCLFCIGFILLTGANPPVVRAGFMMILLNIAPVFEREADAFNSIGLSLTVMLLLNPYNAFSISLWLSVLATLGILLNSDKITQTLNSLSKRIRNKIKDDNESSQSEKKKIRVLTGIINAVISSVLITVVVTVFTLPVFIVFFGRISVICVIANILLITLGTFAMELAGISALLMCMGLSAFGSALLIPAGFIGKLIIKITSSLASLPVTLVDVSSTASALTVLCALVFMAIFLLMKIKNKAVYKTAAAVFTLAFFLINATGFISDYKTAKVYVCKSEAGLGVLINYKGNQIVIDTLKKNSDRRVLRKILSDTDSCIADYLITPESSLSDTLRKSFVYSDFICANIFVRENDLLSQKLYDYNVEEIKNSEFKIKKDDLLLTLRENYVTIEYGEIDILIISDAANGPLPDADILITPKINEALSNAGFKEQIVCTKADFQSEEILLSKTDFSIQEVV